MKSRSRPQSSTETLTLDLVATGRDEMNLAEFPIALLADRVPKGTKTLIFRDNTGELTVTGSDAFGLPTASDTDVIVALIQLTKLRNNFTNPCVHFTRYELLRLLGWPNEGKSYRRLDDSLNRWVGVSLHYDGCWWDNRSKQYGDAKIHILESVVILDGKSRIEGEEQQAFPLSSFTWNKVFMESCQADNLKRLDVDAYFALEHASSKRLYRFLDKRFYRRGDWAFDLKEVAFERVGLSRNYGHNVAKIKEKLQPAIEELEIRDFLEPMAKEQRYFKEGKDWKVRLHQKQVQPSPQIPDGPKVDLPPLVTSLVERGVTESAARELVNHYPVEQITQKLEIFDWLSEKNDKRVAKSPAGYLVKSINDHYAIPAGFVPSAERERREVLKRAKEDRLAASRRAEQVADARERAERSAIDAYWATLTPEQQAELDANAQATADPETLKLAKGPMKRFGVQILRNQFIRQRLQVEGKLPALAE